jgi:hypothetical protein
MGKIKALVALLVIGGAIYVAWNMIPPYFNNYQFQDTLDDIARRYSYTQASDEGLKEIVITKAQSNNIALKPEQITVTRGGEGLGITVRYRVHVDLMVHPVDIDFVANSLNKRI